MSEVSTRLIDLRPDNATNDESLATKVSLSNTLNDGSTTFQLDPPNGKERGYGSTYVLHCKRRVSWSYVCTRVYAQRPNHDVRS